MISLLSKDLLRILRGLFLFCKKKNSYFLKSESIFIYFFLLFLIYHTYFLINLFLYNNETFDLLRDGNVLYNGFYYPFLSLYGFEAPSILTIAYFILRKWKKICFSVLSLFSFIYFLGTFTIFEYFKFSQKLFTTDTLTFSLNEVFKFKWILESLSYSYFLFTLISFVLCLFFTYKIMKNPLKEIKNKYLKYAPLLASICFLAFFSLPNYINTPNCNVKNPKLICAYFTSPKNVFLYAYENGFLTSYLMLFKSKKHQNFKTVKSIDKHKRKSKTTSYLKRKFAHHNIIVIQLETFPFWLIDHKENGKFITPFLNNLKNRSLFFDSFYAQHSGGWTSDAELSSLTSLLPLQRHGNGLLKARHDEIISLPEFLSSKGYKTYFFHSNIKEALNRDESIAKLGFDQFYHEKHFKGKAKGWLAYDKEFFDQSSDLLSKKKKPFLAYLLTIQGHYPYNVFKKSTLKKLNLKSNLNIANYQTFKKQNRKNRFFAALHEVDQAIEFFFKKLKKLNLEKDTLIFIYGDHIRPYQKVGKGEHIPFLIYHPKIKAQVIHKLGSHLDISPTITHLLNFKDEPKGWVGTSLLKKGEGEVLFNDISVLRRKKQGALERKADFNYWKFISYSKYMLGEID